MISFAKPRILLYNALITLLIAILPLYGMESPIKPILVQQARAITRKTIRKRVAFKARTLQIVWNDWRYHLFTDSTLPLEPLFDPLVVEDFGLVEIQSLEDLK